MLVLFLSVADDEEDVVGFPGAKTEKSPAPSPLGLSPTACWNRSLVVSSDLPLPVVLIVRAVVVEDDADDVGFIPTAGERKKLEPLP